MDEQQFLNEINAIPWEQPAGNDDYRNALLVFADWLEERGDPRSELIRLREGLLNDPTPEQRQLWEPRMQALIHNGVQPIQATWENSIGTKFCWCPPGKFMMGSPEMEVDRDDDEDQVEVTLTQGLWLMVTHILLARKHSKCRRFQDYVDLSNCNVNPQTGFDLVGGMQKSRQTANCRYLL